MRIKWYMGDVHACGMLRAEYPAQILLRTRAGMQIDVKLNWNESDIQGTDLMIFQRSHQREQWNFMRMAQERGVMCLYDTDDDMMSVPPGVGRISEYHGSQDVRDTYRAFYQYADAITVTTVELARAIKPLTMKEIYVVANATNPEHWDMPYAMRMVERSKKEKVSVGWTNSPVHVLEAPLVGKLAKWILDTFENADFFMFGTTEPKDLGEWTQEEKYKGRILQVPWINDCSQVPMLMRGIDIGICPLTDIPFNKSRSNIKWQQYSILGQPSIVQKCAVYGNVKDGETGFVADSMPEWCNALERLIESKELREEIGARARLEVMQKHDLRREAGQWSAVWQRVLSERKR